MKNFKRVKENFVCGNCGAEVSGDGYTDHCPKCLWGRHVDDQIPGDRASECREMMAPIGAIYEKGQFKIHYRCTGCGHEFLVREGEGDDREELLRLIKM
ncbi:MAG TPA: RNHCP domain-containing protein [Patescibacteria group bacterium]